MARYRLLVGQHVHGRNADGTRRIFRARDPQANVIETDFDLEKLNSPLGKKFEKVPDGNPISVAEAERLLNEARQREGQRVVAQANKPPVPAQEVSVDAMTLKQLQDHAAAEEIDLKGAKTRDEALRVVKAATQQLAGGK